MPFLLGADAQLCWLEADPGNRTQIQSLLKPYPRNDLQAHPVSTQMNASTWDDLSCIETEASLGHLTQDIHSIPENISRLNFTAH